MILVYSHKSSPRLRYTLDLLFRDILLIDYELSTDQEAFNQSEAPKFSYAKQALSDELFFQSHELLFENGITEQNINVFDWGNSKAFFSTGKNSVLPFDPFAASFYLTSRYEEYLPHIRDQYDRFEAKESLATQQGFIHQPVVDIWAYKLRDIFLEHFPKIEFPKRTFNYTSTIDIDNAYAYKLKGLMRTLGGYAKSILTLNWDDFQRRTKVLLGLEKDHYDTYDFQLEVQKKYNLKTIYFFLLADYGINDKNVPHYNRHFQSLIKSLGDHAKIGIHPSFNSNRKTEKLKMEIDRLAGIVHREITRSRQHFLILHLPHTYRRLVDLNIKDDYSMGYAAETGFRAGTCTPFYFYDLDLEMKTKLRVHPFTVMEATLKYYKKMSPERSIKHINKLVEEVKKVDGTFISLWHNETLSDYGIWKGWPKVYLEMVKAVTSE